jgi:hypothetical protein
MVGRARIASNAQSTGPRTITISIGPQWCRPLIDGQFLRRIDAALALGMRALVGPRRIGDSLVIEGFGEDFYESSGSPEEVLVRGNKTNGVDSALHRRGVGRARAVKLGLKYSRDNGEEGEWWAQGLGRAGTKGEREKVHEAINEWADGDAIAAHIGYGNDFFCTHDHGVGSGSCSALHPKNRGWLQHDYGVAFVTPSELAGHL